MLFLTTTGLFFSFSHLKFKKITNLNKINKNQQNNLNYALNRRRVISSPQSKQILAKNLLPTAGLGQTPV